MTLRHQQKHQVYLPCNHLAPRRLHLPINTIFCKPENFQSRFIFDMIRFTKYVYNTYLHVSVRIFDWTNQWTSPVSRTCSWPITLETIKTLMQPEIRTIIIPMTPFTLLRINMAHFSHLINRGEIEIRSWNKTLFHSDCFL